MGAKTYWQRVVCDDRSAPMILQWFSPLCDEMTPTKAEVLCDIVTDKERKFRVFLTDKDGKKKVATRTFGRNYTVALSPAKGETP